MSDFTWEYKTGSKQLLFIRDESGRTFGVIDSIQIGVEEAVRRANLFSVSSDLLIALKTLTPTECPIVTHHGPNCGFCFALKVIAEAEGGSNLCPEETPDRTINPSPISHESSTHEGQYTIKTTVKKSHVAPATGQEQTTARRLDGA